MSSTIGLGKPLKSLSSWLLISAISQLFSGSLWCYINNVTFVWSPLNCNFTKKYTVNNIRNHTHFRNKWPNFVRVNSLLYLQVEHDLFIWDCEPLMISLLKAEAISWTNSSGAWSVYIPCAYIANALELLQSCSEAPIMYVDLTKPENYKKMWCVATSIETKQLSLPLTTWAILVWRNDKIILFVLFIIYLVISYLDSYCIQLGYIVFFNNVNDMLFHWLWSYCNIWVLMQGKVRFVKMELPDVSYIIFIWNIQNPPLHFLSNIIIGSEL